MKKLTLVFSLFSFLFFFGNEAQSQIIVKVKPNRPGKVLVKPAQAKEGHIWVAGHWKWNAETKKYNWVKGHWVKARAGHNWAPGKWVVVSGGHKWVPGSWAKAKARVQTKRRVERRVDRRQNRRAARKAGAGS